MTSWHYKNFNTTYTTNTATIVLQPWTVASSGTGALPPVKPRTALDWLRGQVEEICALARLP